MFEQKPSLPGPRHPQARRPPETEASLLGLVLSLPVPVLTAETSLHTVTANALRSTIYIRHHRLISITSGASYARDAAVLLEHKTAACNLSTITVTIIQRSSLLRLLISAVQLLLPPCAPAVATWRLD